MRILTAIDSFKGSMTSKEANKVVKETLTDHDVVSFTVADGGEGTVQAFVEAEGGDYIKRPITNVNGKTVLGTWGFVKESQTAVIEVAEAAGIIQADKTTFHPRHHTSFGVGEQISQALDYGAKTIILGLGGSATVDGGIGMMMALGVEFLDEANQALPILPVDLSQVKKMQTEGLDSRVKDVNWLIASDVTNPLLGRNGATHVFGPQKGFSQEELIEQERAMRQFSQVVKDTLHVSCADMPGAGAAGGIGFSCYSFFGATFQSGLSLLSERGKLKEKLRAVDLVITGEGKFDSQSLAGKVPIGISRLAKEQGIPTVVFAGKIEQGLTSLKEENILVTLPIVNEPMTLETAIVNGPSLLKEALERFQQILRLTI
ncbi:glycerate kinase [Halolactibacillus halophilus]|uniref:Glycerate kinase n=1 Tax=Halolactibacillus halophilus TaxID=306540 RepID=A0A1I5Q646_9BACI|nr:glycerate kinase [Halolactibacillus halophilus]GEM01623.1 glycerate kinase [Halolactibacillus halophilus]SFP41838.1 glycerate kinase [Halolactibacillus halophilus]